MIKYAMRICYGLAEQKMESIWEENFIKTKKASIS